MIAGILVFQRLSATHRQFMWVAPIVISFTNLASLKQFYEGIG